MEQMKNAADEGSIIIVNVTRLRSDAIAVSSTGFRLVPLPYVDAVQAQNWVNQDLTTTSSSTRGVKNKAYREFLAWLWRKCVKPILKELDHHDQSSPENLPRVWWIGTGLVSSFPFHAAVDISAGPNENTYRRVLSSYTPSIKALTYARDRVPATATLSALKLLIVAMPSTPGATDLPGVKKETSSVVEALGTSVHVEILDQPDAASVMRQIHQCNIAHFACHGISDSTDPSQSGLLLQTAPAKPRLDILTVRKLCENHHLQGEIAYLSACSTAENRAKNLVDEVLHVVSGFQVAGFRHVVGCLWPSSDNVCVKVARSFYVELCRNGAMNYTDRDVAMALHKAVSEICDEYRKQPLLWAQYVHYGA
jgi:CHAT domain-containing protein